MGNIWAIFVGFLQSVLLTFFNWFEGAGIPGSAGLAIILFTIVARLIILPLTLKSLQSTRRMQELQPQIKEIQRKYGKDQAKLSEETMKLYKEYKVNPAGGCLPMVLQFPIFIGVYQAVLHLTQVTVPQHAVGKIIVWRRRVLTPNLKPERFRDRDEAGIVCDGGADLAPQIARSKDVN